MASAKLLLLVAITATLSMAASASLLDSLVPIKTGPDSDAISTKEGDSFSIDDPSDSDDEDSGSTDNPGTKQQELVLPMPRPWVVLEPALLRPDGCKALCG